MSQSLEKLNSKSLQRFRLMVHPTDSIFFIFFSSFNSCWYFSTALSYCLQTAITLNFPYISHCRTPGSSFISSTTFTLKPTGEEVPRQNQNCQKQKTTELFFKPIKMDLLKVRRTWAKYPQTPSRNYTTTITKIVVKTTLTETTSTMAIIAMGKETNHLILKKKLINHTRKLSTRKMKQLFQF